MKLKLKNKQHEIELLDEITGEIAIEMERSYKTSVNIDQEIEQNRPGFRHKSKEELARKSSMKFDSNSKKVLMEFAHMMIVSIKDKDGKKVNIDESYVKTLGLTDFKALKKEIERLTEGVDFF